MKIGRIDQMLPNYSSYDAIGDHVEALQLQLQKRGYDSKIFVEASDRRHAKHCYPLHTHRQHSRPNHLVIYHHSIGCQIPSYLLSAPDYFFGMHYHNITPPEYFEPKSLLRERCHLGLRQLHSLQFSCQFTWTVSTYSAAELCHFGFHHTQVVPILRNYDDLTKISQDQSFIKLWKGTKKNLVFVGRIAPLKSQHDLLALVSIYQRVYDQNLRLILVGSPIEDYLDQLKTLARKLGLKIAYDLSVSAREQAHVIFLQKLTDEQLARIYQIADIFICYSDHEGFCVPIIEAMTFGLPVIYNAAAAIPETCGDAGIKVHKHRPEEALTAIDQLIHHADFYQNQCLLSKQRALDFQMSQLEKELDHALNDIIHKYHLSKMPSPHYQENPKPMGFTDG